MARKTVDTAEFQFSHGRTPHGFGSWGFQRQGSDEEFWAKGTFTEARKQLPAGDWKVLP